MSLRKLMEDDKPYQAYIVISFIRASSFGSDEEILWSVQ